MSEARMHYLLKKYFSKTDTPAEREELSALLVQANDDKTLKTLLEDLWMNYQPDEQMPSAMADRYFDNILRYSAIPPTTEVVPMPRIPFYKRVWWRYAAAILLIAGAAIYLIRDQRQTAIIPATIAQTLQDKPPGRPGAILTLADGSQVELDSLGTGVIAQQNGTQVVLGNGQLAYAAESSAASQITYNTMHTPRGRQFQLLLPDGSKVWLNAATTLKYPTGFTTGERIVEMEGEAYFEVAKDPSRPFRVKLPNNNTIEVLGTHFNVNSYTDEKNMTTTLLEGAVSVNAGSSQAILRPGEQALAGPAQAPLKVVKHADIEQVMAWKNGYFHFDGLDLPAVMRQISRWYDVEVEFKGDVPRKQFGGELPRAIGLQQLLKLIEFGEIKLVVDGNHITVIGQ